MNKKIILTAMLTICLIFSAFPIEVHAEQTTLLEMLMNLIFPPPELAHEGEHIKILNPVSKPTLWGRWVIEFETKGEGTLGIEAYGKTFFEKSIEFLKLYCGNEAVDVDKYFSESSENKIWIEGLDNGKIIARNWECGKKAKLVLRILETGHHYLKFSFLGDEAYAENYADCTGTYLSPCHMCDVDAMNITVFSNAGSQIIGEVGSVSVGSTWTTVNLDNSYTSPVVVANYYESANSNPLSVRIRNVGSNSFQVKLQLANQTGTVQTDTVYYMVMEEGVWVLTDGTKAEAHKYTETHVIGKGCSDNTWNTQWFSHHYSQAPVVIASVMSENEANWTTDHVKIINETHFNISMEMGEYCEYDPDHADETMGWIAIETGVTSTVNNIGYETKTTGDNVQGHDNGCYSYSFSNSYSSNPLILWEMRTRDGSDGGWMVTCNVNTTHGGTHVEEDLFNDTERSHTTEDASMIVFETAGNITARYSSGPHAASWSATGGENCGAGEAVTENWTYSLGYTFCPVEGDYNASMSAHAEGDVYEWESSNPTILNNPIYTVNWDTDENWCNCKMGASGCSGGSCWGPTRGFGFDTGTNSNCCGDDSGEYYRYCNYVTPTGFPDSGDCVATDDMCCNISSDCVTADGNTCVASGSYGSTDADSDGDTDYCLNNKWYDCYDNGDCVIGGTQYECVDNDCDTHIINGGSGTTCDASNPCLFIQDSGAVTRARFDDNGYVDVKGSYSYDQTSLSPPANSFVIHNSGGTPILYIDSSGNLATIGRFVYTASPSPSGNDDFIVKDSAGTIVGFIDSATGNLYFKGDLHYNSNF